MACATSTYLINEHVQSLARDGISIFSTDKIIFDYNPYNSLPPETSQFLMNHASTFSGTMALSGSLLIACDLINQKSETKLKVAFGVAATIGSVNLYKEVIDIPKNMTGNIDYGDLDAIGLGLACFLGLIKLHTSRQKLKEPSLSL